MRHTFSAPFIDHNWTLATLSAKDQTMMWFEASSCLCHRLGQARQGSSGQFRGGAAEELLKWPKSKKRDRAATLLADAMAGTADMAKTKKAFEAAAKEANVWVAYRGP